MKHLDEQQLLEYRYGDATDTSAVEQHLRECAECRKSYEALKQVLAFVDALPVADPGANYETRLWRSISPKLERPGIDWSAWTAWLSPKRLIPIGAVAALVVTAFLAGRYYRAQPITPGGGQSASVQPTGPAPGQSAENKNQGQARERILLVAVGDHLDSAQSILLEISNAEADGSGNSKNKEVDISQQQQRAEDLVSSNRLYRQTALKTGDTMVASVLDDLEPILLEIAHSPSKVSAAQLDELQQGIEARGLLLKVRVLDSTVRNRQKAATPHASTSGS
jgi:hypothetical protein